MSSGENKNYMAVYIFISALSGALWLALISLKGLGAVNMHWALVLSGLFWIAYPLFALFALSVAVAKGIKIFKRSYYIRKAGASVINRINEESKDRLRHLNGEDVEKAAEFYEVFPVRLPGETDEELRRRIYNAIALKNKDIKVSVRYEEKEGEK